MSRLQKLTVQGGTWISADQVFHVDSLHALTQAAGYLKFVLRDSGPVFFRGQGSQYSSMYASLYRGVSSTGGQKKREQALALYLQRAREAEAFIKSTPDYAHEPILQHYGVRTRWLDLVDNIWVALWFACHQANVLGSRSEYLHFHRKQRPYPETDGPAFVYVALVSTGKVSATADQPGVYRGAEAEAIDLRVAAPSLYLRPHAQHGVLIRKRNNHDYESSNLQALVVGLVRAELGAALQWLGLGDLLSVHTLFPPPHYDFGYRRLLAKSLIPKQRSLGSVQHVGA